MGQQDPKDADVLKVVEDCCFVGIHRLTTICLGVIHRTGDRLSQKAQTPSTMPKRMTLKVTIDEPFYGSGGVPTGLGQGKKLVVKCIHVNKRREKALLSTAIRTQKKGSHKKMCVVEDVHSGRKFAMKWMADEDQGISVKKQWNALDDYNDSRKAATLATEFGDPKLRYVVPCIAQVVDGKDGWRHRDVLLEYMLEGVFEKFVFIEATPYHDIPQAFCHFTYKRSHQKNMLWDIQGTVDHNGCYLLTDPFFYDEHTKNRWRDHHECFKKLHLFCSDRCFPGHQMELDGAALNAPQ